LIEEYNDNIVFLYC